MTSKPFLLIGQLPPIIPIRRAATKADAAPAPSKLNAKQKAAAHAAIMAASKALGKALEVLTGATAAKPSAPAAAPAAPAPAKVTPPRERKDVAQMAAKVLATIAPLKPPVSKSAGRLAELRGRLQVLDRAVTKSALGAAELTGALLGACDRLERETKRAGDDANAMRRAETVTGFGLAELEDQVRRCEKAAAATEIGTWRKFAAACTADPMWHRIARDASPR